MTLSRFVVDQLSKRGATDVVVSLIEDRSTQIKFANSKIPVTKQWVGREMEIFAAFGKRTVATSLRRLDKETAMKTVDWLERFQRAIPENEEFSGIAEGPFKYKDVKDLHDGSISSFDAVGKVAEQLELAGDVKLSGVLETEDSSTELLTSHGIETGEKASGFYYSARAQGGTGSGHKVGVSNIAKKLDFAALTKEALSLARESRNPKKAEVGKFPVLFSPLAAGNFLDNTASSLSSFSVDSGMSPFKDKLGEQVASDKVTLIDWGNMPNGFASSKFDDEGRPTQKTAMIKGGKLASYLHNTSTAKNHGQKPTGNAGIIAPEPTNIVLEPGKRTFNQMLSSIKEGYYITNLWYTRFNNHTTGDFSTIPRDAAFFVKDGKVSHPVKDLRISDNLVNILKNVSQIGNDPRWIRGWEVETPAYTPFVLVDDVNITKSI